MRTAFTAHLAALDTELIELCAQVCTVMRAASQAGLAGDLALAESALSDVADIEASARSLADSTVQLVARQQPVAHDLRCLLGAQRVAAALRRMAQLAGRIAKAARRDYPAPLVPAEVRGVVQDMAALAESMVMRVHRALASHDAGVAGVLLSLDAQMDALHQEMLVIVSSSAWPYPARTAVSVCMLSRDYERFADHAVEIGFAVGYVVTGVGLQVDR